MIMMLLFVIIVIQYMVLIIGNISFLNKTDWYVIENEILSVWKVSWNDKTSGNE